MKKISFAFICAMALLSFTGCKKKEPAADPAAATKPAETAAPATATATPAAPAAPAAGASIASDDDYVSTASKMMDTMISVIKGAGTNCDKLADDITKMAADNGPTMKALQAYDTAHPDAKKKFDAAAADKTKAFEESVGPAMSACQNNKKVADAFEKLAPG